MDDITIEVSEFVNNISVTAQPNDQTIDITVTETVETVLLDVSTTVDEVTVTATQNVIVENITVDYVNNENNIDINVTDATQDVTLNITPTLVEINILRSGGEVNILQFDSLADFPATGSSDYFYLAKDTNKIYRWTGSAYAEISATANAVWGQIIGTLSEQTDLQNALNLKAPINSPTFTGTVSGITKAMVGLGQVDNTSDLDKPISTATQTALNAKQPLDGDLTSIAALSGTYGFLKKTNENSYSIDTNTYLTEITSSDVTDALGFTPENAANKGVNNGYASLDGGGKVPSSQLPSYVDDVIEVSSYASLPSTGETGKIYITLDTNKIYRWTGSVYVEVSSSAAVWGGITGTLSNQTDLQTALDAKQDDLNGTGFVKASGTMISYDNTVYYPDSNPDGYTSNVGTVTSVAMTVPSAFSVSGSPITSSGTLAVTATGNATQYIAGDGSLVTFPTMSTAGTLIREVRNTTGATLTKGTVVYISGATGNKPTVSKAIATGDSTSAQTFGLVQSDIADNANGNVVCAGDITGIDTSALTEGAQLYLSSTTAGAYTTTKQYAPAHLVYIGIVTRAHPSLGQIEVNIQNGYELDELHNVAAQTPSNNDGLFYETSTSLWKNKSIATVLGYTPANGADYMSLSGDQTIAGLKTFSGFALFDHNIFIKQGTDTSFLSGYNVIDASSSGIFIGLPNTFGANLVLSSLTTQRNFTFPDAAGTIALTSDIPSSAGFVATTGDQSIAGDKTFSGAVINDGDLYLKQDATYTTKAGYTNLFASGSTLNINFGSTINAVLDFSALTLSRTYTFPNTSGTIALTSDLHNAVTIGTANGLSLSTQVLSLGLASTSTTGALSSTDWNTFNGKQNALTNPVTGTGTSSYLPKFTGTTTIGNSLLYDTGSVLLIGATSASDSQSKLELVGASPVGLKIISSAGNGNNTFLSIQASKEWRFLTNRGDLISGNQGDLIIRNNTDGINHIILNQGGSTTFAGSVTATSGTFNAILKTKGLSAYDGIIEADNSSTTGGGIFRVKSNGVTSGFFSVVGSALGNTNRNLAYYAETDLGHRFYVNGGTQILDLPSTGAATFSSSVTANQLAIQTTPLSGVAVTILGNATNAVPIALINRNSTKRFDFILDVNAVDDKGFGIYDRTNGAYRFVLSDAGNVGIGTTAPYNPSGGGQTSLEMSGTNYSTIYLSANSATVRGQIGADNLNGWVEVGSRTNHPFLLVSNNTERMRITSGGNVLMNQTSVIGAETLNLTGSTTAGGGQYGIFISMNPNSYTCYAMRFFNSNSSSVVGSITVGASTTSYNITSDYRLKEDLKPINGLEIVNKIKVYDYKWKATEDRMDGVLAHELAEILPYAVHGVKDGDEMQGVDYSKIVPVLIQAIKEQQIQIEQLKNK